MEPKKFKTDIKCAGCIMKVTPFLDKAVGAENWKVDIDNPAKILAVTADATEESIKKAVLQAGYKAERLTDGI